MTTGKQPEVVVITGASAGLGRAVARAFARRGAHIGLLARGRAGLEGASRDVEILRQGPHPAHRRRQQDRSAPAGR